MAGAVAVSAAALTLASFHRATRIGGTLAEWPSRTAGLAEALGVAFAVATALQRTAAAFYGTYSRVLHASTLAKSGEVVPYV
jgi:hypothetical protein